MISFTGISKELSKSTALKKLNSLHKHMILKQYFQEKMPNTDLTS